MKKYTPILALLAGCTTMQNVHTTDNVDFTVEERAPQKEQYAGVEQKLFSELEDLKAKTRFSPEAVRKFRPVFKGLSVPGKEQVSSDFYFTSEDDSCNVRVVDTKYLPESEKVDGSEYMVILQFPCDSEDKAFRGDYLKAFQGLGIEPVITMDFPTEYWATGNVGSCERRYSEVSEDFKVGLYKIALEGMLKHVEDLSVVEGTTNFSVPKEGKVFDEVCRELASYTGSNQ